MVSSDVWSADAAARYDNVDDAMFSDRVLVPTVDFLVDLADGGAVLEFAIGTGRVAVPVLARGLDVSGIELSAPMIEMLRTKVSETEIPVQQGDMASTLIAGEFSLVYLVFNTIANLLTQDEQVSCFANAARHLRTGGHFVIECWIPQLRNLPPGQRAVPFEVAPNHTGIDTFDDLVTQQLTSHHYGREPDGSYRYSRSRHRYVWPSELDLMARLAGMELVRRVADWDGSEFTGESRSAVSVWRKAR